MAILMLSASSTFCSEQHQHAAAVQVLLAEKRAAGIHIGGAVLQALRPALRPACCSSAARRRGALQRVRGRQATAPNTFEKEGWVALKPCTEQASRGARPAYEGEPRPRLASSFGVTHTRRHFQWVRVECGSTCTHQGGATVPQTGTRHARRGR